MQRHLLFPAIALAFACAHTNVPLPATPASTATDSVARGEYIVRNVAACGGCHSSDPKNPDAPLSGGKEFRDWRIGVARGSNLTPDVETGLGSWSDAEIVRAMRTGERKGGRLLAPVMPYDWFHDMSDDDAFAIARYLKSLPPVNNPVKQSPNLIFKLGKLFLSAKSGTTVTAPPRAATAEYGSYLSQHVGLCGECHTPRSGLLNRADMSRLMAGVPNPPKDFPAKPSNLRAVGASWTEEDFLRTMRTGIDPSGHKLNPFMPWPQNARMTDDDLRAIYRFLRTIQSGSSSPQTSPGTSP